MIAGFALGVLMTLAVAPTAGAPIEPPPVSLVATSSDCPTAETSSVALCPCPRPPPARRPAVARARRAPPLPPAKPQPSVDPTGEVMRYLRQAALGFSRCAPQTGAPQRIHLELKIQPTGALDSVRIANIEPVPPAVARCAEEVAKTLEPPAFDGDVAEVFSLTLVL